MKLIPQEQQPMGSFMLYQAFQIIAIITKAAHISCMCN